MSPEIQTPEAVHAKEQDVNTPESAQRVRELASSEVSHFFEAYYAPDTYQAKLKEVYQRYGNTDEGDKQDSPQQAHIEKLIEAQANNEQNQDNELAIPDEAFPWVRAMADREIPANVAADAAQMTEEERESFSEQEITSLRMYSMVVFAASASQELDARRENKNPNTPEEANKKLELKQTLSDFNAKARDFLRANSGCNIYELLSPDQPDSLLNTALRWADTTSEENPTQEDPEKVAAIQKHLESSVKGAIGELLFEQHMQNSNGIELISDNPDYLNEEEAHEKLKDLKEGQTQMVFWPAKPWEDVDGPHVDYWVEVRTKKNAEDGELKTQRRWIGVDVKTSKRGIHSKDGETIRTLADKKTGKVNKMLVAVPDANEYMVEAPFNQERNSPDKLQNEEEMSALVKLELYKASLQ